MLRHADPIILTLDVFQSVRNCEQCCTDKDDDGRRTQVEGEEAALRPKQKDAPGAEVALHRLIEIEEKVGFIAAHCVAFSYHTR